VNQIRLLRVFPPAKASERISSGEPEVDYEIFDTRRDEACPHKALSYKWGLETDPRYPIVLNGKVSWAVVL
jgi:hypothetical protein